MTSYYPRSERFLDYGEDYLNSSYIYDKYEGPLSIPPGQDRPSTPQLYSRGLKDLSRRTDYNLAWFSHCMSKVDPCYIYSTEHWHYGTDREKERNRTLELHEAEREAKSIFSQNSKGINREDGGEVFCYLCSTLEEHQKHLAKRGLRLKPKPRKKYRVQYIVPPPVTKAKKPEPEEEKQEVLYKIIVKTGKKHNAGTGANVFVRLIGSEGRMKKRQLKKSFGSLGFHFGQGSSEKFFIKGPDIGRLQWLTIQHDGQERKDSWYLEEVEITNMATEETVLFICNTWLSLCMADYTNKIDLQAEEKQQELEEYRVTVVTGKKMLAGTDARVFITLYGNKGVTAKTRLNTKDHDPFEKGAVDTFNFVDVLVGNITKIRIEHDNSGRGPGWYLECVEVDALESGRKYRFPCGQWLATDEGDGTTYRYLYPLHAKSNTKKRVSSRADNSRGDLIDYHVTVVTGTCYGAGTDARVYINMYGSGGRSTGDVELDDEKDNFEKGQVDEFRIKASDVGRLKKIRIRHDNTSLAAGWFLETITLHRYFSKADVAEMMSRANENLEEKVMEKASELTGTPYKKKTSKMHHKDSKKYKKKSKYSETESETSDSDDSGDKARYTRRKNRYNKSDDSGDEYDKKKRRTRRKKSYSYGGYKEEVTETESESESEQKYKKSKHKGRKHNEVSCEESDDGKYGKRRSKSRKNRKSDTESDEDDDDDSERETMIKDGKIPYYEEYVFVCKKWLATDEGDGKIERELTPKRVTVIYKV